MFKLRVGSLSEAQGSMDHCTKVIGIVNPFALVQPSKKYHIQRCHDIVAEDPPYVLPKIEQFAEIIDFAADFTDDDVVMVHCSAGISRSTATAIMILMLHGADEQEAFGAVYAVRPQMNPNSLIIKFADELLGLDGSLSEYHRNWLKTTKRKPVNFAGQNAYSKL